MAKKKRGAKAAPSKPADDSDSAGLELSEAQRSMVAAINARGIHAIPKDQRALFEHWGPIYLAACPKKTYLECSGRPNGTVITQGTRYELPYSTQQKAVDLRRVIRWVHDFLARHGQALNSRRSAEDEAFDVADAQLKKEMAVECVRQKRLANMDKEIGIKKKLGELFPLGPWREFIDEASKLFNKTISSFGGSGTVEKSVVLNKLNFLLEDFDKLAEEKFGDGGDSQSAA